MVYPLPRLPDGREPTITSGYGYRGATFHGGDDIMYHRLPGEPDSGRHGTKNYAMPDGVPALAVSSGIVESARERFDVGHLSRGFGVVIRHDAGYTTFSNHGKMGTELVRAGQPVYEGQPLFEVGGSFGNQGPDAIMHLHFELWPDGTQANRIDPAATLATLPVLDFPQSGGWLGPLAVGVGLYAVVSWLS